MTTILSSTGDFVREVAINPIEGVENTYQLAFSSRLATAKHPLESKKNFDLILAAQELMTLRNLIDEALAAR